MARSRKQVGSVYTEIRARLDKYERDLGRAKKQTRTAAGKIQRSIDKISFNKAAASLKKFSGLLGVGIGIGGVAGLGLMIKRSLEAADSIAKLSDVIGVSSDTLQEYEFAASQSGISTELLQNSLIAFSKRVGEARQGTGALVTFLNKYDKSLLQSVQSAASVDEALELIFKRMGAMSNATDRAALAASAFSRSGVKLANIVKNGAEGLEALKQEARDLGLVLKEDTLDATEKTIDAIDKLQRKIKATFTQAIIDNAADLTEAVDGMREAFVFLVNIAGKANRVLNDVFRVEQPESYKKELLKTLEVQREELKFREDILTTARAESEVLADVANKLELVNRKIALLKEEASLKEQRDEFEKLKETITSLPDIKKFKTLKLVDRAETEKVRNDLTATIDMIRKARFEELTAAENKAGGFEEFLFTGKHEQSLIERAQAEADLQRRIRETTQEERETALKAVEETNNKMIELTERTAWAMQENFSDLFFDFMKGELKTLEDYSDAVFTSISRAMADLLSQQLVQGLFGNLNSAGGGGGLVGAVASAIFGAAASAKGNVFNAGKVQAFANGGIVSGPTMFPLGIAGEKGPEAILPLSRTSSGELGVKSAGSSVVQNFNINISAPQGGMNRESLNQITTRFGLVARRAVQRNA